jgi:hypothetical protein
LEAIEGGTQRFVTKTIGASQPDDPDVRMKQLIRSSPPKTPEMTRSLDDESPCDGSRFAQRSQSAIGSGDGPAGRRTRKKTRVAEASQAIAINSAETTQFVRTIR